MSSGLLIEDVRGTGSRADLRPGDVIIAVISKGATTEIKTVDQFNKLLAQFEKGSALYFPWSLKRSSRFLIWLSAISAGRSCSARALRLASEW